MTESVFPATAEFFAACFTQDECMGAGADGWRGACNWGRPMARGGVYWKRCLHEKRGVLRLRFYEKVGPAKAYITIVQRREKQTADEAYVLVGQIADMRRLTADAQTRYEHAESRATAHATIAIDAMRDASAPAKSKSRRKEAIR